MHRRVSTWVRRTPLKGLTKAGGVVFSDATHFEADRTFPFVYTPDDLDSSVSLLETHHQYQS